MVICHWFQTHIHQKMFLKYPARIQIFKNEVPKLNLAEVIGECRIEANLAFI